MPSSSRIAHACATSGIDVVLKDVSVEGAEKGKGYNKVRGDKVIEWSREFLDRAAPLESGSHKDVTEYSIASGQFTATIDGNEVRLQEPDVYVGYAGDKENPTSILLRNNGLYLDIQIDPESPVGSTDKAGVKDIVVEAAVSSIMDFEDSVAAVDATDKTLGYRNWLGILRGTLTESFDKGGKIVYITRRRIKPDEEITVDYGKNYFEAFITKSRCQCPKCRERRAERQRGYRRKVKRALLRKKTLRKRSAVVGAKPASKTKSKAKSRPQRKSKGRKKR